MSVHLEETIRNSSNTDEEYESTENEEVEVDATSPGQLQDVTMDNSYVFNKSSPSSQQHNGSTSPGQGRSVREFEEQMAALRKENFNLKLRLFFMEEKLPGYSQMNTAEGQESLMKQCIDTKVEVEILRKELSEKQVILIEAAQALTEMETFQKNVEIQNQKAVDELNQRIIFLEMGNKELDNVPHKQFKDKSVGDYNISSESLQKIKGQEEELGYCKKRIDELSNENESLKKMVVEQNCNIEEIQMQLMQTISENNQLKDLKANESNEADKIVQETNKLRDELQDNKRQLADRICMLQDIEESLKEKTSAHENACKVIQKLMINIKNQQDEISHLKKLSTSNSIETSSGSGATMSTVLYRSLSDTESNVNMANVKIKYKQIIEEKNDEIVKLKLDVKKKTANLQNLVNKELWEKNREIERLTKIVNNQMSSTLQWSPVKESDQLQKSFTDKEYNLAIEQNAKLKEKVDKLMERVATPHSPSYIDKLKDEVKEAKAETERSEKWRQDCSEVCSVLTSRLEELAGFLDSLLKHKDVLGALALDKRRAIRKAVDKSLDLSRSLNNMSLSLSGLSIDHSLPHLSNLSCLLDASASYPNKTFNSHETLMSGGINVIQNLQAEVNALKLELNKRKSNEFVKKERRSVIINLENQSESEAWSEPDRNVSHARMGLEDPKSAVANNSMKDEELSTDSDRDLNPSLTKLRAIEKVNQLEQMLSQRDNRLLEVQCELVEADNRFKQESLRVIEITRKLDEYKQMNLKLQKDIEEIQNTNVLTKEFTVLRSQLNEKTEIIEKIKEDRDQLQISNRIAEIQIESLKTDIENTKLNHDKIIEIAAEQEQFKLEKFQKDFNDQLSKKLEEQENKHKDSLMREWVSRKDYEDIKLEIERFEKQLIEAQNTIEYLNENEIELKNHLIENEKATRALKKNLDDATLQASKAVLERTKALSDKLILESKVNHLMEQIDQIENQKIIQLQKITQLENDFKNQSKIIKENSSGKAKNDKLLNRSDASQSGYTSEDVPIGSTRNGDQRLENSSPDLGIESDAGRASSTEISNMHTQLLKTIKISASEMITEATIENLNNSNRSPTAANVTVSGGNSKHHDCAKVDQENTDLRRKLNRTKRAFEDIYNKLRIDNHRKEQVERDIKNQILKTHNVLKNVRSNIENEMK